jgi:hypothetical protein
MQFRVICSESLQISSGSKFVRTLLTLLTQGDPEYLLANLLESRGELKQGKTYRITIEEEG